MQTYAVVDCDFRFVKVGRTGDLQSRLTALNTASPRPLLLMATFDGDIEQGMHRLLCRSRERLEWFRYNSDVETTIVSRMTPTKEWFASRQEERKRRRKLNAPDQMAPVDVGLLSFEQRDAMSGADTAGPDCFGAMFGIPSETVLRAVISRRNKQEIIATRRILSGCRERVCSEIDAAKADHSYDRLKVALFAQTILKNWRRRIGLELGALTNHVIPNSLS